MPRDYYERHLPHWHPPGAALFLTCRLADSIPQAIVKELQRELETACQPVAGETPAAAWQRVWAARRRHFGAFEAHLEQGKHGPRWLAEPAIAAEVLRGVKQQAAQGHYTLEAACVMPNHVHLLVQLPAVAETPFYRTLQCWKSTTALQCNRLLGRAGRFWQPETYDHVVRGDHDAVALGQVVRYIFRNPVKAGLCSHWTQWDATYLAPAWEAVARVSE